MKKILIASLTALALLAPSVNAEESLREERLGLNCNKILGMKYQSWTKFYAEKKGGWSELTEDIGSEVYAECMKERNNVALAKLPANIQTRIKAYRQHTRQYSIASLYLQQAYAGGGTMYTHMARRDSVSNEELVKKLIRLNQSAPTKKINKNQVQNQISQLRAKLRKLDPAISKNRAELVEYSTTNQGQSSYTEMRQSIDKVLAILPNERSDVSLAVINFLAERSNRM
jgi:hypothetical protein